MASSLLIQNRFDEAIASYRDAIRVKADFPEAHQGLGQLLMFQRRYDLAAAECREAIRLRPDAAEPHVILGMVLSTLQKRDEALAEHRLAQRLNPDYPEAHCSMAMVLYNLGDYAGAAAEAHAGAELRSKRSHQPWSSADTAWVANLERTAVLAARLPAIAKGDKPPAEIDDQLFLASIAYDRKLFATSAQLWSTALDAKPELGNSRQDQHRYNAACSAALAAAGEGKNEPCPDAAARAGLRQHALAWLRAELDAWAKLLDSGKPKDVAKVVEVLQHWREDADLAAVRDAAALDSLPADEQKAWRTLWSDAGSILARARACSKG